jgi:hypothetical protein
MDAQKVRDRIWQGATASMPSRRESASIPDRDGLDHPLDIDGRETNPGALELAAPPCSGRPCNLFP